MTKLRNDMRVEVQKMINSTVEENSKKLHREITILPLEETLLML